MICLASLGVAYSHVIPNYESAAPYQNIVFLPTIFISGVFYDVDSAPKFLTDIAQALPLVHIIDGLSGALVTGRGIGDNLSALAGDRDLVGRGDLLRRAGLQLGVAPGMTKGAGASPRTRTPNGARNSSASTL